MPQAISQTIEVDSAGIPKQAGRFVRWFDADAAFLRSVEASQQVTLSGGSDFAVTISLIGVKGAITALRNCQDELLRSWGVDTEALTKLRDLPKPDNDAQGENPGAVLAQRVDLPRQRILPGSWVSYNDYPSEALRREISGTVVMALSLNPSGRVENCRVVVSSKADVLDRRSCEVLSERAKYSPALSTNGSAVRSTVIERIRWMIP